MIKTENNFDNVLIVSSDGDYSGLVKFLCDRNKLLGLLSPAPKERCSILLKRTGAKISYLKDRQTILEKRNEKAPNTDRTVSGSFS